MIDKENGAGVSQDFNDNINNAETGICFQCHIYKKISEFGKSNSKYVCNTCWDEVQAMIDNSNITFVEVPGRQANSIQKIFTVNDVYGVIDGERFHLGGYQYPAGEFDVASSRSQILLRQKDFLNSNGGFVKLHCHADEETPEQFIEWVKEIKDNFGSNYNVRLRRCEGNYWEFSGNLERLSCAFCFRIFTEKQFDSIAEKLDDPYFKNVKVVKDTEAVK